MEYKEFERVVENVSFGGQNGYKPVDLIDRMIYVEAEGTSQNHAFSTLCRIAGITIDEDGSGGEPAHLRLAITMYEDALCLLECLQIDVETKSTQWEASLHGFSDQKRKKRRYKVQNVQVSLID